VTERAIGKPHGDLPPLLNRERAILEFNRRVLAQARRDDVPLLERLRYVCIVSSNLDEFFEIRFADTLGASRRAGSGVSPADMEALAAAAHALIDAQYAVFNDELMPALVANGIRIVNHADRDDAERRWVDRFFETQVRPLLVPVGLDPAHPFPQVANKSLNFIARLAGKDAFGRRNTISIVKVPRVLPRVMRVPGEGPEQSFVLLTSVIRAHLGELFPGREVEAFSQFRITRDSDLEVDADVSNLRQALRSGLTTRHYGQAVRLEVVNTCPAELSDFLLEQFNLPVKDVTRGLARKDFYIPGSILRTELDTMHPIAKGMPQQSIAWFENSPAFEIQGQTGDMRQETGEKTRSPVSGLSSAVPGIRVIATYPKDPKNILLSGWALGAEKIAGKAALVEFTIGKGKIVLFGFRPQYRGQSLATFPLLFNAISQ